METVMWAKKEEKKKKPPGNMDLAKADVFGGGRGG